MRADIIQCAGIHRPLKDTSMNSKSDRLLFVVDHAGTILFAMEGAFAAIAGNLDFFGVMVVSFATALGGGVLRDVLIGATPPQAIRDWRYAVSAFATGGAVFILHQFAHQIPSQLLMILDTAGLALFAVAGTQKVPWLRHPSLHRHFDGDDYWRGWRSYPGHSADAYSHHLVYRHLRHCRADWLCGDGAGTKVGASSGIVCGPGWRCLFFAPRMRRLVSLEPAQSISSMSRRGPVMPRINPCACSASSLRRA